MGKTEDLHRFFQAQRNQILSSTSQVALLRSLQLILGIFADAYLVELTPAKPRTGVSQRLRSAFQENSPLQAGAREASVYQGSRINPRLASYDGVKARTIATWKWHAVGRASEATRLSGTTSPGPAGEYLGPVFSAESSGSLTSQRICHHSIYFLRRLS
jgi:hypothetical protein